MMNTMIAEILGCLIVAGLLGLLCGWMIKAAGAKRKQSKMKAYWSEKYSAQKLRSEQDIENLEDQLQNMGNEVKTLTNTNRSLNESLRKNETSIYQSRTDAIELNRQQAETQERLQRIIMEKDEELNALKNTSPGAELGSAAAAVSATAAVTAKAKEALDPDAANNETHDAQVDSLTAKREAWERERQSLTENLSEDQPTVALDQSDIPADHLDKTVKLDTSRHPQAMDLNAETFDDSGQLEDSTVALDDLDDTLSMTDQDDRLPGGKPKPLDDSDT
jgi:chromosome segregation ATPase